MASKYIFQLRRGVKTTDSNGNVTRDDWATYTQNNPTEAIPREGELVIEYDNGVPRLKIGNGTSTFAELEYMSVDSFILPKPAYIELKKSGSSWLQDTDNRWYQDVAVVNATVTSNSKIDLQPSPEQLSVFSSKNLAFVAENDSGNVRVYCVGQVPSDEDNPDGVYKLQVTVTEVVANE